LPKIKEWIDVHDPGSAIIPFSGALELKLMEMSPEERAAYLKEQQTTRY
jgi:obg-like ATPase 1